MEDGFFWRSNANIRKLYPPPKLINVATSVKI